MLVAVEVVGLNPIDWKAPDFGFGLPSLPCISGRDFAGKVVKPPRGNSRFRSGDIVMGISTDYRDSRKAAYQQYAVVSDFNACSSATGCCAVQLAKLAGLKVIAIIDVARSGEPISIVKGITKGKLRFGLDTRGRESTALLAQAMRSEIGLEGKRAHLVGLTGLPKEQTPGVVYHSVPIKTFHEAPNIGEGLMIWLERLFEHNKISTPEIEVAHGGLQGINAALDRLRDGSVNGPRIVVPLELRT
ncbi:hypothetical protein DID88_005015 [Monilinia fructigena]|uniref:Alcohol dehydrogenase-like N-terminal domain-containing protein n=1 Tax=Monilinia fructigena TaxID=38457 RepID=A0A395IVS9_9HELO|nr:hypothetical protein DID88_005015 [Monilinia fructigena]